jgi:hypothetical protein
MKNAVKLFGMITLVALIAALAVVSTGCWDDLHGGTGSSGGGGDGNPGGNSGNTTWTAVTQSVLGSSETINAIAYGNNKFVTVGQYGKMAYSTNN